MKLLIDKDWIRKFDLTDVDESPAGEHRAEADELATLFPESPSEISWTDFPVRKMAKLGWISLPDKPKEADLEGALSRFFGSTGPQEALGIFWRRTGSFANSLDEQLALLAWTQKVLSESSELSTANPFTPESINMAFLKSVAQLSRSTNGPRLAQQALKNIGVRMVVVRAIPGTKLDGAAMMSADGEPVIGLTIRHDRIDNFWFTLLHEIVHIWRHIKAAGDTILDDLDEQSGSSDLEKGASSLDPREREADRIAGEALIPRSLWRRHEAFRNPRQDSIEDLARRLEIHPAIVAGKIRRQRGEWNRFTSMLGNGTVRVQFPEIKWS